MKTGRRKRGTMDSQLDRLLHSLREPRTMRWLTSQFRVDDSTIYRWIRALRDQGNRIGRADDQYLTL